LILYIYGYHLPTPYYLHHISDGMYLRWIAYGGGGVSWHGTSCAKEVRNDQMKMLPSELKRVNESKSRSFGLWPSVVLWRGMMEAARISELLLSYHNTYTASQLRRHRL